MIDGVPVPITSRGAINKLSSMIAEKYKQDYSRLLKTDSGRRRLLAAQDDFVPTSGALDRILEADHDNVDVFIGSGTRVFPDGTVKQTHHAFLIGNESGSDIVVYDPNDPGLPISCELRNTEEGVTIEWTCRYKHTGQVTTQRYLVVHKDRFFQAMLGESLKAFGQPGN